MRLTPRSTETYPHGQKASTALQSRPAAGPLWYPGAFGSCKADGRAIEQAVTSALS